MLVQGRAQVDNTPGLTGSGPLAAPERGQRPEHKRVVFWVFAELVVQGIAVGEKICQLRIQLAEPAISRAEPACVEAISWQRSQTS